MHHSAPLADAAQQALHTQEATFIITVTFDRAFT